MNRQYIWWVYRPIKYSIEDKKNTFEVINQQKA